MNKENTEANEQNAKSSTNSDGPRLAKLESINADLLDALEAVLPDLEHYVATHGPGPDKRLAIARAAIAKARG